MAIRRREAGDIVVLYPAGAFYGDRETEELQTAILGEAEAGNQRLILNLGECQSLNSIAVGALMRGFANYRGRAGEIKLCCLGKRVRDLLTLTKLIMVFDHHETEEEAVGAFRA